MICDQEYFPIKNFIRIFPLFLRGFRKKSVKMIHSRISVIGMKIPKATNSMKMIHLREKHGNINTDQHFLQGLNSYYLNRF
jgi:hypothetical protein